MRLEDLARDARGGALRGWGEAWQRLTPETIPTLVGLAAADVRFRDPFQEIRGRDAFEGMLRHVLATVSEPRFVVTDHALGLAAGYLRWRFTCRRGDTAQTIEGMSEIAFTPDGLVASHLDHWDSGMQVYARLPVLGVAIRAIARRIAAR
ncbi:nuclear transport factor 2 family protein [Elioraea sp.]|uniref:nuclear transport factor 2 family protein n=1 Tax=Elioraea sp. TaxID=2185103 RepID=UPI003F6F8DE5